MKAKLTTRSIPRFKPAERLYMVWDTELPGFLLKVRPSGRLSYGIWYRVNGKAAEYTIGAHGALTPDQARAIAKQKLGEVAAGVDIQAAKKREREQTRQAAIEAKRTDKRKLGAFLDAHYAPWLKRERKSADSTLSRLKACFVGWLETPIDEITPWMVEKWQAERLRPKPRAGLPAPRAVTPATVNRDLHALSAALSKAVEWGIIEVHPLRGKVKPLRLDSRGVVRYLSDDEEARLRQALTDRETAIRAERSNANAWRERRGYELLPALTALPYVDHLRPLVLLAVNTGLRRGELFGLRWPDVNLPGRTLTIHGASAKSGQTRHVPLNNEALVVLKGWRQSVEALREGWRDSVEGKGYVFAAADGARLVTIKTAWSKLLVDAGIERFRFHDLRHHFASRLVMAGCDLNTVRELLGHADIQMTLRYAHLTPEHKAAAVGLLDRGAA